MNYDNTLDNHAAQVEGHERELQDVFTERLRQLRKHGPQSRPPFEWFLILSEEVGEVAKECVEMQFNDATQPHADPERYYQELTEVAAVALAAMQNFNQRREKCFHDPDDGGCSLCSRPIELPSRENLRQAFQRRYGKPDRPLELTDIRDVMVTGGRLQVQVSVYGFTDWYAVRLNYAGLPDPISIEKLPF